MGSARSQYEMVVPAEPRVVQLVRERLAEFARACGLGTDDVEELRVAVSEACANAVSHGSPHGARDHVTVRFRRDCDRLTIDVCDEGGGFRPGEISLPEEDDWKPGGRGLFLMQALTDGMEFYPSAGGTCVRLVRLLPAPSGAAMAGVS